MATTAKKKATRKKAPAKPKETHVVRSFADMDKLPLGSSLPAPCHGTNPGVAKTWGQ